MKVLSFFFIFVSTSLFSGFEDHLKKVENKSDLNRMENIDFIYMINLDQRPEKLANSYAQLHPYEIFPCRFSALNGWDLSLETLNDIGLKFKNGMQGGMWGTTFISFNGMIFPDQELMYHSGKTYFIHHHSQGAIGCSLSHLSILKDAYESGYQTIWVMEDDIHVQRDPRIIPELIKRLDQCVGEEEWDILFTDIDFINTEGEYVPCTTYEPRPNFFPENLENLTLKEDISPDFTRIKARFGAHSMIVRRSGMKKILDFIRHYSLFLPFDVDYFLPPGMKLYSLRYDVVSQLPNAISDNSTPIPNN